MAHQAAWEVAEQGEEAVEEAATTIFQKIVRSKKLPNSINVHSQEVPRETAQKELSLFWAWAPRVCEINKVSLKMIGRQSRSRSIKGVWCSQLDGFWRKRLRRARVRTTIELRRLECSSRKLRLHPPLHVWQPWHLCTGRGLGEKVDADDRCWRDIGSSGGTDGSDEQKGAVSSFALPPVQRGKDQEEKPCQVEIRNNNKQRLHYLET